MKVALTNRIKKMFPDVTLDLEEQTDDLYSWTVHLTNFYEDEPDDTLILINNASRFTIYVVAVNQEEWEYLTNEELSDLLQDYLRQGLEKAGFYPQLIEKYLKKTGEITLLKNQGNKRGAWFMVAMNDILSMLMGDPSVQDEMETVGCLNYSIVKIENEYYRAFERFQTLLVEEFGHPLFKETVLDLEIELDVGAYLVRRLIRVPANRSFSDLHLFIQKAFRWRNEHLYQFEVEKSQKEWIFTEFDPDFSDDLKVSNAVDFCVADFLEVGDELTYIYDFGDYWEHKIKVVQKLEDYSEEVPQLLAAEKATPPENVGGAGGFEYFLEAIENEDHPDHAQMVEWYGWGRFYQEYSGLNSLPSFL